MRSHCSTTEVQHERETDKMSVTGMKSDEEAMDLSHKRLSEDSGRSICDEAEHMVPARIRRSKSPEEVAKVLPRI